MEVVKKFNDPRIKIYRQIKNSGEGSTRNLGLQVSTGKYVYFIDSDDAILKNTLETFYNTAEEYNLEIVYMDSFFYAVDSNFTYPGKIQIVQGKWGDPQRHMLSNDLYERLDKEYLHIGVHVMPWIKLQRRDFLIKNQILFPQITHMEDVLFNFAELLFVKRAMLINECSYIYRQSSNSITRASFDKQLINAIKSIPVALNYLQHYFSKVNLDKNWQVTIEEDILQRIFQTYVIRSRATIDKKSFNEIVNSMIPDNFDLNTYRVMFNLLAEFVLKKVVSNG